MQLLLTAIEEFGHNFAARVSANYTWRVELPLVSNNGKESYVKDREDPHAGREIKLCQMHANC